ncbi:F-box domain [Arabidopsis thaliana x Arabidopsis arenosa]|uniref:F-box domain n=1 Tax=Arabidopsis thaliana x Arabidopsis arenosa TaxID=1240361 RepID=A0A8T2GSC7_9BRAS|nr:F-box domain [Arabidopsis thaliana x Arabidopsis arenosa]
MTTLKTSSFSSLPWDLVEDILARVPATSLKRLRSTCKQWNFLFNDQIFTKMHFDKAEKQFLVLILRLYTVCSMSLDLRGLHDNIDPSIEVKGELSLIDPHCSSRKTFVSKVFHCNGLLLCTTMTGLVVWNPCTDQTRWIKTEVPHNRNDKYALGYGNYKSCYNYKIMKFLDLESFDLEIYEVNSNSWRVLGTVTPDFTIPLDAEGVSLRGNSYWIASHKREEIEEEEEEENEYFINDFLISFDFTTERFGPRVSLPFKCESSWDTYLLILCTRRAAFTVFSGRRYIKDGDMDDK